MRKVSLINKIFGKLTVLSESERRCADSGSVFWKCQCCCGNIIEVRSNSLIGGKSQSCGCKRLESTRLPYGEAAKNKLYKNYLLGAKNRNLPFEITKDEFIKLTSQNCYYCNISPRQICQNNGKKYGFYGNYIYNGIDRLNNQLGYIKGNLVACCGRCNCAKMSMDRNEFLNMIMEIYNNYVNKNKLVEIS